MFNKSVKSALAICAAAFILPQAASAAHVGYSHGYHYGHNHINKVTVTTKSGSRVKTKSGAVVGAKCMHSHSGHKVKAMNGMGVKRNHMYSNMHNHKHKAHHHGDCVPSMSHPYYVFFANNSSTLSNDSKAVIREAYESAMMHHVMKFKLSGHASNKGDARYNMKLSARRAAAVEKELMKLGATDSQVSTAAFGENVPYTRETRMPNERKDRRVELRYVYNK